MSDTQGNPGGAGYLNAIDNGAVRQQYIIDPAATGGPFAFGAVMEIESYAGPGTTNPPTVPLVKPSSTTADNLVVGVLRNGPNYQGLKQVLAGMACEVLTQGITQVLCDATTTAGQALIQSPSTAGCARTSASPTGRTIGVCLQSVTISSGTALVWAYIDPGSENANSGGGGSLTSLAGSISAPVSFSNTSTPIFSTASLAVGTWLVTVALTVSSPASATGGAEVEAVAGTATATLAGVSTAPVPGLGAALATPTNVPAALSFIATVTVAATLTINAVADMADTGYAVVAASGTKYTGTTASGYTAVKIA